MMRPKGAEDDGAALFCFWVEGGGQAAAADVQNASVWLMGALGEDAAPRGSGAPVSDRWG